MSVNEETKEGGASPAGTAHASYELTASIAPYLDRHLILPLLEYSQQDVSKARLELLTPTHMVDYAMECYKAVHGTVPEELKEQKQKVYEELEQLRNGCQALLDLTQNESCKEQLIQSGQWNVSGLTSREGDGITVDMMETYRKLARFQFDCGDYQSARDMLTHYITWHATPPPPSPNNNNNNNNNTNNNNNDNDEESHNNDHYTVQRASSTPPVEPGNASMYYLKTPTVALLQVLWGKLACEILVEDWKQAKLAVDAVKTAMELLVTQNTLSALQGLQQRTWLLHWSLFVYWNHGKSLDQLIELYMSEKYKQAIATVAPHLLRYLTAAVLLCKRSSFLDRKTMKLLVQLLHDCEYTDPIVEFVDQMCVQHDFSAAQTKLNACQDVLQADFFLCQQTKLFMEEARIFVFENYCRIHHKMDLSVLGERLAMEPAEAERWMVELVRHAKDMEDAASLQDGCVLMTPTRPTVHEQIMERTKDWNVRTATLAQSMNTLWNDARKERTNRTKAMREYED